MKILLTGANGQLGRCFQDRLPEGWQVRALGSAELDIGNKSQVEEAVLSWKPDAIVNAGAYTAVDKAESEPESAARVNTLGPENLAHAARSVGAKLIHVSTDYVFDGKGTQPYRETDTTNPLGVYGKTKLDGENAVQAILPEAAIIRTAWVFSEYGSNFVKTMVNLAEKRDELGIVSDQRGCPTYAGDLATAIIELLQSNAQGGIYHFGGDREVSWFEFADKIFDVAVSQGRIEKKPTLNAVTTDQYPTPARRPAYSVLAGEKIKSLGVQLSNWEAALTEIIRKF
ncbi:dTDP-4-dehydrorhamnose reductase [Rouxiella badensis]|jgi:dTDP-4-dehydrorhamnose reductase|uniref:dTDP-4-dehydrorhamnose reductase n=1 Tax=Rouxiella badensis TaxID=1646377 RepID=A0A1X0WHX0_9GAMM|nr:dTDP-4-dehydrorhamnose reductase [Rouxiella badensis]MCC3703427.1 dTDP-4-dehydrorhamnose reductase [Rouxiella badensis]MCC3718366.1 dTDP-4-dehydrorhamnose reductase [Rouxiella badensis]MCC3726866.1 dTDP-4-dehydrorhamnose reductase [Rouxiella badensis]MCC3731850.1 dTDP-4-dehydrorhamnose reductase [Rouxiella badensis]MCC3738785.1 dTDP-4-dehydrorhamnose reductase [Rouxiella badensis]